MLYYLLKSGACLIAFFLFYKVFLEKTTIHQFKRYYLLSSIAASFAIPLITFTTYLEAQSLNVLNFTETESSILIQEELISTMLPIILGSIYGLGVLFFGIKFLYNISTLVFKIKRNPKVKNIFFTYVLVKDLIPPHTFFNYIFLNSYQFVTKQIPEEVLLHEQTHAKQKHSIDILFIESLKVIFWFNPLVHLYTRAIKLNHEFLADRAVLDTGANTSNYQNILLNFSSNTNQPSLANAINYSLIKKRFNSMKTQTSKGAILIRSFLLLPLVAMLLVGFSNKEIVEKVNPDMATYEEASIQDKATAEQLAEFNKLAKHYNAQSKNNRRILLKDVKRLEYIYSLMSNEQRANAEPFPDFPPPPPPIDAATEISEIPPPPPPLPESATAADKKKYRKVTENYIKKYGYAYKDKYGDVIKFFDETPPPPPIPPNPVDHIINLAKKGATFYYEDKKISSDKAIDLVKKNKDLNIQIRDNDSKNAIVRISTKPIKL